MHDKLVILAGGASSRMKKPVAGSNAQLSEEDIRQANERSKGLIGVGADGRPLLDYVLFNAKKAGYRDIYIIVSENSAMFREHYGSKDSGNEFHGLKISFAIQYVPKGREKPFGTADALTQAAEQFPILKTATYAVCNSDNLYSVGAFLAIRNTEAIHAFPAYNRDKLDFQMERIFRFSLVKFDDKGYMTDFVEKPEPDQVEAYRGKDGVLRVSMNIFKFDGAQIYPFLKHCPVHPERNEKELPTALLNMVKEAKAKVLGIPFEEHVPDLTAKEDIISVKQYLADNYPSKLDW